MELTEQMHIEENWRSYCTSLGLGRGKGRCDTRDQTEWSELRDAGAVMSWHAPFQRCANAISTCAIHQFFCHRRVIMGFGPVTGGESLLN
jgi:hypothetical protein